MASDMVMGIVIMQVLATYVVIGSAAVAAASVRSGYMHIETVIGTADTSTVRRTITDLSLMQCAFTCREIPSGSFYFTESSQTCQCNDGLGEKHADPSGYEFIYGVMMDQDSSSKIDKDSSNQMDQDCSSQSKIGQPCNKSTDCLSPNTRCQTSTCSCIAGYSYNPSNCSCVTSCQQYGSTFQRDDNHGLDVYTTNMVPDVNETECKNQCVAMTMFVCRTASYDTVLSMCTLSAETKLTQPHNYGKADGNIMFQRDCA